MEPWLILKVVWAFAVIALLLVGLTYGVRLLARGRLVVAANRRLVSVVESTFLAQNVTVHVIKVGEKYFLVGGGSAGVTKIDEVPAEFVTPWLEDQKRSFTGQRDAVVRLMNRIQKR
jgi:flagellar biogenesis protein FliO